MRGTPGGPAVKADGDGLPDAGPWATAGGAQPRAGALLPHVAAGLLLMAAAAWLYIGATWPAALRGGFDHNAWEAWALLHGHIATPRPPSTGDMAYYDGRWYSFFPPLPAVLLMPLVWHAQSGTPRGIPLVGGLMGTVAVGAVYATCAQAGLRWWVGAALTALFGFGTVFWYSVIQGTPWYFVQVCTVFFYVLALRESFGRNRPALVGTLFGCALLCRNPVALGFPFLFWRERTLDWRRIRGFTLPVAGAVGLQLLWNYARFGNPLDTGYGHIMMASYLRPSFEEGMFSIRHLPWQVYSLLFAAPAFRARWPYLQLNANGQSLLLTTPAFLYALEGNIRDRRTWLGLGAALATAMPQLLYYANGWVQFGERFSLDYTPLLMALLIFGIGRRFRWQHAALIGVSVFLCGYGAVYGAGARVLPHGMHL